MEWVDYKVEGQLEFNPKDVESCQLFGCREHGISLVVNEKGQVFSTNDQYSINLKFPEAIDQILCACREGTEICQFYLRSVKNQVYEWNMQLDGGHFKKRMKLDSNSMDVTQYNLIAENIHHIMPCDKSGILLFSSLQVDLYDFETNTRRESSQFRPSDMKITSHQYFNQIDSCFSNFFSLKSINHGLLYGTREGSVYCRNLGKDPAEDTLILVFESTEKAIHVELLNIPALSRDLNTLVAIGDGGTIMIYSRVSNDPMETGVNFKQFNIQGPIYSIGKLHNDAPSYLVASGIGRISVLGLKFTSDSLELESTYLRSSPGNFRQLRICGPSNFDALCSDGIISSIQYNPIPVSIANNPKHISALIKDTLAELEFNENTVKSLENKEQVLNQKLYSTNRTLYALRSINQKRKLGICNSLEDTGFEFQMRPITRSESISNCSLHSTSYLRICIKTSRFLELEDWDLVLDLFPPHNNENQKSLRGEIKTVPVMGFETHYENGIERYSHWERDVEINLEKSLVLPLKVSATLVMSVEGGELPLRFPVSKIMLDDLHYAVPCSPNFMTSIERRGLEEVSMRLMDSYIEQKLHDKTGRYPFARLIRSKLSGEKSPPEHIFSYRNVHIRCSVNPQLTEDSYRSILSTILGEGRTMNELSGILTSAEQALFTLAAYPGSPVIIHLSHANHETVSPNIIDFSIQCIYPPALFKTEAALLARLYNDFIKPINGSDKTETGKEEDQRKNAAFLKKLKLLENSVIDLQEKYQAFEDQMDIDSYSHCDNRSNESSLMDQLKKAVDMLLGLHNEEPIGYLEL